jgi:hypothetical protein
MDLPPKWSSINPANAALVPSTNKALRGRFTTFLQRKKVIDRIWNKSWAYGNNRCKGQHGAAYTKQLACSYCDEEDSQHHLYLECPGRESIRPSKQSRLQIAREVTHDRLHKLHLPNAQSDTPFNRLQTAIIKRFHSIAFDPHAQAAEHCWNGMIPTSLLADICGPHADTPISMRELGVLRKSLLKSVNVLSLGATRMTRLRSTDYRNNQSRPSITRPLLIRRTRRLNRAQHSRVLELLKLPQRATVYPRPIIASVSSSSSSSSALSSSSSSSSSASQTYFLPSHPPTSAHSITNYQLVDFSQMIRSLVRTATCTTAATNRLTPETTQYLPEGPPPD